MSGLARHLHRLSDRLRRIRRYGGDATIHRTGHVDVEVDRHGNVCAVWFRCVTLPFNQVRISDERAASMRRCYGGVATPKIAAIEFDYAEGAD